MQSPNILNFFLTNYLGISHKISTFRKMKKVYVIAGHEGKGTGAISKNPTSASSHMDEGEETIILQRYICYYLETLYGIKVIVDDPRAGLFNVISWLKGVVGLNDIILDVHFNAFANEDAHGTEVLTPTNPDLMEKLAAQDLLHAVCLSLGTYPRGVFDETRSPHQRLGMLSGPSQALNLLVEVCFCTNESDAMKYFKNRQEVAKAIAGVLAKYANQ